MSIFSSKSAREIATLKAELTKVTQRSTLLDEACGVGLWEAVLVNSDAMHP
jgi:hypothetical protein